MKSLLMFFLVVSLTLPGYSQAVFIQKGKIEFERKTNTHRLYFSGETDSWAENFKKLIPQFRTDYFDLYFDGNRSLYKPGREPEVIQNIGFFESPATTNVIYHDGEEQKAVSQKQVFETLFLIADSLQTFEWKIEPETRTIAGFECHKAVTRICDSVVVVAFYSDEIVPSTGPESFNGLPGMILGLAVPRLYTTWFATKVEVMSAKDEKLLTPPTKGKKAARNEMIGTIDNAIKNWGNKYHDRAIWFVTL